jgi:hypothetical protein
LFSAYFAWLLLFSLLLKKLFFDRDICTFSLHHVIGKLVRQIPEYTVGSEQTGHVGAALPAVRLLVAAATADAVIAFLRQWRCRPGRRLGARAPAVQALVAPHRRAELLLAVRGGVVRGEHPRQPLGHVGRHPGRRLLLLLLVRGGAGLAHDSAGEAELDALDGVVGLRRRRGEAAGRGERSGCAHPGAGAGRHGHVGHGGRGEVGGALLGEEVEHLVLEASERGLGEVRDLRRRQRGGDLGHEVGEGLVRDGVDAHPGQLLLELGVPVVLDVVVRPPRQLRRDHRPPVADDGVQLDDGLLLGVRELAVLEVGPQVVGPPEPAALAAPLQPCSQARGITNPGQSDARRASGSAEAVGDTYRHSWG